MGGCGGPGDAARRGRLHGWGRFPVCHEYGSAGNGGPGWSDRAGCNCRSLHQPRPRRYRSKYRSQLRRPTPPPTPTPDANLVPPTPTAPPPTPVPVVREQVIPRPPPRDVVDLARRFKLQTAGDERPSIDTAPLVVGEPTQFWVNRPNGYVLDGWRREGCQRQRLVGVRRTRDRGAAGPGLSDRRVRVERLADRDRACSATSGLPESTTTRGWSSSTPASVPGLGATSPARTPTPPASSPTATSGNRSTSRPTASGSVPVRTCRY